jgi:hypothetical protein
MSIPKETERPNDERGDHMPGFLLSPFRMLLSVDGGTADR